MNKVISDAYLGVPYAIELTFAGDRITTADVRVNGRMLDTNDRVWADCVDVNGPAGEAEIILAVKDYIRRIKAKN